MLLVVILTAIGYDYSKQYMSVSMSSCWMDTNLDSPYILK